MKKIKRLVFTLIAFMSVFLFMSCDQTENIPLGISFEETNIVFSQIGDRQHLTVTASVPDDEITWVSSNPKVAYYDKESGDVVAMDWGICIIRATIANGADATCMVTVNDVNPEITLSFDDYEFGTLGESVDIKAYNKNGHDISDLLYWSSSNISVATIKDGVIQAVNYGTCLITATARNGNSAICIVETHDPSVPTIDFEEIGRDEIIKLDSVGDEIRLTADIFLDNAEKITWISSDPSVVSCTGGRVKALSKGVAVIIAATESGATAARMIEVEGGLDHVIPEDGKNIFDYSVKNIGKTIKFIDMNTDELVAAFIITGVRIEGEIYSQNGVFYLNPYFTCVKVYDKDGIGGTSSFDAQLKLYNEYNELCEYYRCRYVGMKVGDTAEAPTAMFGVADKGVVRKFNFVLVPVIES